MKRRGALIGLLITVLLLYLALRNVDLTAVAAELAAADYRYLLPASLCTLGGYALRTLRWQQLLRPIRRLGFGVLFRSLMLGFAANNVLPARVGELVRAYTLGRKTGVSVSMSLATVVVERLFDGLTLLLLMALALQIAPIGQGDDRLRLVETLAIVIFLGALAILIVLLALQARALALLAWCLRPLPARLATRLNGLAASFLTGLGCLRYPSVVLRAGGLSLLVWGAEALSYALLAQAFGLGLSASDYVSAVLFLVVFVNLGIMVPSAPGYIGTFQFFARLALAAFAVSPERALGLAVLAHATQYVLVTGIGLVILWREQISLLRLVNSPPPAEPAGD